MSFFDIAAGLVLLVSVIVGWIRGGTREVAAVAALAVAAIASLLALRFTGPIARHAIHPVWLANLAAALAVFAAIYILLRIVAGALTRRIHHSALSGVDRSLGAGFGLARALVVLGLAGLTIGAVIPAERLPGWISDAALWPAARQSGQLLQRFAPRGVKLARDVAPKFGQALGAKDDPAPDNGLAARSLQGSLRNRVYNDTHGRALQVRVEKAP